MPTYRDDLSYIHHVGFGGLAGGAAPGLLGLLREAGIREGLVVDLGCGSGLWARELTEAGYEALGIDSSAAMSPAPHPRSRTRPPSGTSSSTRVRKLRKYVPGPRPARSASA